MRTCFIERLGLTPLEGLAAEKRVPIHRLTLFYFLGGMALFLFAVQVVTGILLSLHYKPSPDQAFESVRTIMTQIHFGWLIRSAHSWSANLLIGVIFLHLLTTYIMRAYRRPREFTWVTGLVLMVLFLAFGFSGYLLPWNQLSFFATRVGTALIGQVPAVGQQLMLFTRGGKDVTGDTLAQFYSLHVVILPLATFAILGLHLYLVQFHGMSIPPKIEREHGGRDKVPSMGFFPQFLEHDMVGWYVALGLLAALAALFPWQLGEKANPFASAPAGIRPEWYFLFAFETLKQFPAHLFGLAWLEGEIVAVLFFALVGVLVVLVPLLDWRAARGGPRPVLNFLVVWAVFALLIQTLAGLDLFKLRLGQSLLYSGLAAVAFWIVWFAGTWSLAAKRRGRTP